MSEKRKVKPTAKGRGKTKVANNLMNNSLGRDLTKNPPQRMERTATEMKGATGGKPGLTRKRIRMTRAS